MSEAATTEYERKGRKVMGEYKMESSRKTMAAKMDHATATMNNMAMWMQEAEANSDAKSQQEAADRMMAEAMNMQRVAMEMATTAAQWMVAAAEAQA